MKTNNESMNPFILIIEDSQTQAIKLEFLLKANQFNTTILSNGQDGIAYLQKNQPNLIISDITMPIMNGFDFCSTIKKDPNLSQIPVLLLSDISDPSEMIRVLDVRADALIIKPYDDNLLINRINYLINQPLINSDLDDLEDISIDWYGKQHVVHSNKHHMMNMLLSFFDNAMFQSQELKRSQSMVISLNKDLKKSLKKLSIAEDRFNGLVAAIPDVVYRIDSKGHFTFISQSISNLGYQPEELIGKHFSYLVENVEDVSLISIIKKYRGEVTGNKHAPKLFDERRTGLRMTKGLEVKIKSKKSREASPASLNSISTNVLVEVNSTGLYGNHSNSGENIYIGTLGIMRMLTPQSQYSPIQNEFEFLQVIMDAIPLPLFIKDTQGVFQGANQFFYQFIKKSHTEVIGKTIFSLLSADAIKIYLKEHLLLHGKMDTQTYDIKLNLPDGQTCDVIIINIKYYQKNNEIGGLIGVILNRCDQKQLNTFLQNAHHLINQASQSDHTHNTLITKPVSKLSHELRTPINAILGLCHLLFQTSLSNQQHDYLKKLKESASLLSNIINDIVDYSSLEAGTLIFESVPFDIEEVIYNLYEMSYGRVQEKGLHLQIDFKDNVPRMIQGDPTRLTQVLSYVLSNAIKFTEKGHILLSIESLTSDNQSSSNISLLFSIEDTGIGIPDDQFNNIFKAFSQIDSSNTRQYEGIGLGLTICKHIIEFMKGSISFTSQEGKGSTFQITLPFINKDTDSVDDKSIIHSHKEIKVLLVEDNIINQQIVSEILTQNGFHVDIANHGKEAVDMFTTNHLKNPFDIILMDIHMPIMDGFNACQAIRAFENQYIANETSIKAIPIIAMTAHQFNDEDIDMDLPKGMNDYVRKPINPTTLLKIIRKWIDCKPTVISQNKQTYTQNLNCNINEINIQMGLEKVAGNVELYYKLLQTFISDYYVFADHLIQLFNQKKLTDILEKLHALKGVSGNLGLNAIYQASLQMEKGILNKHNEWFIKKCLKSLTKALKESIYTIGNYIKQTEKDAHEQLSNHSFTQWDSQAIQTVMNELYSLIKSNSIEADLCIKELKPFFIDTPYENDILSLENYIDQFDYKKALMILDNLCNQIKI